MKTVRKIWGVVGFWIIAVGHQLVAQEILLYDNTVLSIEKALEISAQKEQQGDKKEATRFLNYAATKEWEQKNYTKALEHFNKSIQLNTQIGNENGLIMLHNNLGMIYADMHEYTKSAEYFGRTLAGRKKIGEKTAIISSLINLSVVLNNLKKYNESATYLEEALGYARELNSPEMMKSCYGMLSETYEKAGNSEESRRYFELYRTFHEKSQRDKIEKVQDEAEKARLEAILQEDQRKLAELEVELKNQKLREKETALSESDKSIRNLLLNVSKKDLALRLLKQEADNHKKEAQIKALKIKEVQAKNQLNALVRNVMLAGLALLGLILAILIWRYREKQKTNRQLALQNQKITEQRDYLAELNEEINQQKEEIATQRDNLAQLNTEIALQRDAVQVEREKSDKLLLNILPEEVAQELKETGQAHPQSYELASVLFTDFKGFTQIASKMSPQKVIEELNTCFSAFDTIIHRYNLEKIKTIGDSYMCAGGLPLPNTTNPVDIVKAALEMQQWMENWKNSKITQGEEPWEIRIGIHTGAVVAGVVGTSKFAYDIWGDTVNTASRMESSGEIGKVNISGTTFQYVQAYFDCQYRGKLSAKGKGEIEMYFVIGEKFIEKKDKEVINEMG